MNSIADKSKKPSTDADNDTQNNPESGDSGTPTPINLQKRKGDVEPTRYGDWELNGRCIDF